VTSRKPSRASSQSNASLREKCWLDVLVNNVGGGIAGAVEETSVAEAQAVFEVNLWGRYG
jgi:short-subunit dehydrogenase